MASRDGIVVCSQCSLLLLTLDAVMIVRVRLSGIVVHLVLDQGRGFADTGHQLFGELNPLSVRSFRSCSAYSCRNCFLACCASGLVSSASVVITVPGLIF